MQQASSLLFLLQHQLNVQPEVSKLLSSQGYLPNFPFQMDETLRRMTPTYPLTDVSSTDNLALFAKQAAYTALNLPINSIETNLNKNTGFKVKNPLKEHSLPKISQDHDNTDANLKEKDIPEKESENKEFGLLSPSKKISKRQGVKTPNHNDSKKYRRSWSVEEDEKILKLIQELGQNWGAISKKIGATRTGKQIRDRYLNKLDPKISNSKWSQDEDDLLLKLYLAEGRKWCLISRSLPGRTEISVKNRFYSKYRHLFYKNGTKITLDPPDASKSIGSEEQLDSLESIPSNKLPETNNPLQKIYFQNNQIPNLDLNFQPLGSLPNTEAEGSKRIERSIEHSSLEQEKGRHLIGNVKDEGVKIEHVDGGSKERNAKIQEGQRTLNERKIVNQGMELENNTTFDMVDKIDQSIASLEEFIHSSRSGLGFLMSIKQLLQYNQLGGTGMMTKMECCKMIHSVMMNLSKLESNFQSTTQDTNRLLNQLLMQLSQ